MCGGGGGVGAGVACSSTVREDSESEHTVNI